ncbi:VRR-NUC domain-containing protein [uncultured Muribaculum sp.]|uniref:VRR-NUC domain-containing protein n=1 Tax=uncultured Muribaculum sp. TaxID=1918613 RepID=UPI0025B03057|nr:VRR-NUC domain-containing protein [uncultured Muribaculum sp.]
MASYKETENVIQARIVKRLKSEGYMVVKIGLCSMPGFPDLMALKDGKASFVEVKRPGCRPRPLQQYCIDRLKAMGFDVEVLTN